MYIDNHQVVFKISSFSIPEDISVFTDSKIAIEIYKENQSACRYSPAISSI